MRFETNGAAMYSRASCALNNCRGPFDTENDVKGACWSGIVHSLHCEQYFLSCHVEGEAEFTHVPPTNTAKEENKFQLA